MVGACNGLPMSILKSAWVKASVCINLQRKGEMFDHFNNVYICYDTISFLKDIMIPGNAFKVIHIFSHSIDIHTQF
jgi:hypothetical protein